MTTNPNASISNLKITRITRRARDFTSTASGGRAPPGRVYGPRSEWATSRWVATQESLPAPADPRSPRARVPSSSGCSARPSGTARLPAQTRDPPARSGTLERPEAVSVTRLGWTRHASMAEGRLVMRTRLPLLLVAPCAFALVAGLLLASSSASGEESSQRPECSITGTNGDDELRGTSGPDVICPRGGHDHVFARGGDDVLFLGPGSDYFDGGRGDDRIYGGRGGDVGDGGRGNDRIFFQWGHDEVAEDYYGADLYSGGSGNDRLCSADGEGNDRVIGGPGRDYYSADDGDVVRSVEVYRPCRY